MITLFLYNFFYVRPCKYVKSAECIFFYIPVKSYFNRFVFNK